LRMAGRGDNRFLHCCTFCFCHVCQSNLNKEMFYVCLTCAPGPFNEICEDCYLSDRKGSHVDCEFDAVFPTAAPEAWLRAVVPEVEKDKVPKVPPRFLVRAIVHAAGGKAGTTNRECVLGHAFIVGDRLYAALHSMAPLQGARAREVVVYDLTGGELGAWMTRPMKGLVVNPDSAESSVKDDWISFRIVRGTEGGGCKLAARRPAPGDVAFVATAYAVFTCVVLDGGELLVLLCGLSPARELAISGSPIVDASGDVFGLLTTGGTLPPNKRVFGGTYLV
jgi:hypothetical protein